MEHQPLRVTLEPLFSIRGRPLEVWQDVVRDASDASGRALVATI
jgi:hypothetical protein